MIRRPFCVAVAAALVSLAGTAPGALAISVDCTSKPADPAGYEIAATHADGVTVPASTPPIAVLDTGIASVPELQGRIRPGYDTATGDANTNDIDGHGTAAAAIAAGAPGGVRGVSPTSPVIPIKIFDDAGNSTAEDFVAGLERAVNAHAGVINVSAAGPPDVEADVRRTIQQAIDAAVSLGVPIVAASGNEGTGRLDVPAGFAHVIAVGATDQTGGAASYSNTGSGLDLVAPGSDIVTAAPSVLCSSGYASVTGTSFSTAVVSGAVALLIQAHPDLDVGQITDMLRLHGPRSPAPLWSDAFGFGVLNVADVLKAPVPTPDQPEVNDTIAWAKIQPAVLTAPKRSVTLRARIAPHQDPVDVYRLRLKKGDKLRVGLKAPSGTRLNLSFGSKKLAAKRGKGFALRIVKAGTYYVGVTLKSSPPEGAGYTLALRR